MKSEHDANEALSRFADSRDRDVELTHSQQDEHAVMEMIAKVIVWAVLFFTSCIIALDLAGVFNHART